ncbi:hypothetical protein KEM52_006419 [Ascosphaera acerosa]|nr:hypothetical protein KEM52_006419 [Ascosphaera acerosa]
MIEGVNIQDSLETALHLGPGCKVNKDQDMIGTMTTDDCYVFSSEQPGNQGCVVKAPQNVGYGRNFNKAGGAVLATEITKETVTMWYFARGQVPAELKTGAEVVDTSKWGKPMSIFHGDCDFEEKIKDQIIIFNTAFCGDWAKNRWESSGCSAKAATCEEYVQNNPEAFKDVYWSINWMKVYQQDGNAPDTPAQPKPKPQSVQPSAETHSSKAPAPKITLTQATASSALSQAPAPETTTEAAQCTPQPRSCTTYVTKSTITKIATGSAHEKRAAQTLVPARG